MKRLPWQSIDVLLWVAIVLTGCSTVASKSDNESPTQRALIGKSGQAIRTCAGPPLNERTVEGKLLWSYYKEASQFEESFFGSKSSYSMVHHGCWATLMFDDDQVVGVTYESEPASYQDDDHCEEIFQACIAQ